MALRPELNHGFSWQTFMIRSIVPKSAVCMTQTRNPWLCITPRVSISHVTRYLARNTPARLTKTFYLNMLLLMYVYVPISVSMTSSPR